MADDDSVSSVSISGSGDGKAAGEEDWTPANPNCLTKYKVAGEIANNVLKLVIAACVDGANIVQVCDLGDNSMTAELEKVYAAKTGKGKEKAKVEKGIAWPTSISVNNIVGHYSPLASEAEATLKTGDLVKIDLGCHVDGCPALVAHSLVVGATAEAPATGKAADVMQAAYTAAEVVSRLLKPGCTNTQITEAISKVAADFGVAPMEGVLSHEIKRFIVDGSRSIINKSTVEQQVEEFEIKANDVFGIDIVMSTGEGKGRQTGTRCTIYKRAVDVNYQLKLKASRFVFSEINQRFPTMPFTLRALADEKRGKLGITELKQHDLVYDYPVLYEQDGVLVAQVKFTAVILPSGVLTRLSEPSAPLANSEKTVENADIKEILSRAITKSKKKNNKKKKAKK